MPARAFGAFERDALAAGVSKFVSDKSSGACSSDDIVVDAKVSETTASSRGGGGGAARRLAARDDDFFDDGASAFRIAGETDLRVTVTCRRVPSAASGKKAEAAVRAGAKDGSLADALADVGLRVGDGLYLVDAEDVGSGTMKTPSRRSRRAGEVAEPARRRRERWRERASRDAREMLRTGAARYLTPVIQS